MLRTTTFSSVQLRSLEARVRAVVSIVTQPATPTTVRTTKNGIRDESFGLMVQRATPEPPVALFLDRDAADRLGGDHRAGHWMHP